MIVLVVFILLVTLAFFYIYASTKRNYWKKRKVPYIKPLPILGSFGDYVFLRKYFGTVEQEMCQKYPNEPYVGTFYGMDPALIVQDPEIIKLIMTKDFYYFSNREISKYTHKEVITQNLFFTYGDRWKVLRQNLTPLFTSTKMKNMFHLIEKCSYAFENMLDFNVTTNVVDTRTLAARFTMDSICSCAFGVNTKTMDRNSSKNQFTIIGNMIQEYSTGRAIKWISRSMWPAIFYGLRFKYFPVEVDYFFKDLLTKVFEGRQYKPSNRNDFIDLVLSLKANNVISGDSMTNVKTGGNKRVHLEVDDDLLIANCIVFFAAGYETSATTLSYTLYELAKNKDIQSRVQEELDEYLHAHENKLEYDVVTELKYTDACIDEVLRLYPVLGVLTREVVHEYTLPSGLRLEKDLRVHIPVFHLHYNPENFPDPEEFRPERFLPDQKSNIKPYTYMPFGEGPRICIGMRFAKMQMLAGLVTVLKKFDVSLAEGMPRRLQFDPRAIVTQPIGGINLRFTPRDGWEERMFTKE